MTDRPTQHPEPLFPQRLADDLGRLYPPGPPVPADVDEAILRQARSHFARRRRLKAMLRWAGTASAAAAVILLALWLGRADQGFKPAARPPATALAFARDDIDYNGRVDILDAFTLARRIESGAPLDPALDLNGDGRVDQADVAMAASAAVCLDQPTKIVRQRAADLSPRGLAKTEDAASPVVWACSERGSLR